MKISYFNYHWDVDGAALGAVTQVCSIASLLALGQVEQAVEVFERAGGVYFGYRHGYHALQAVLDDFGPELERRTESLALARLWLLIKSGRPHEVLLRL